MSQEQPAVYVVDDDRSIREALRNLFRSVGWALETFASAQEFLSSQRSDTPSCLVLDVRLPGLSGLDLQGKLAETADFPIVFLTGHADIPMSVRAMKAGAVEFLTKPFRDEDLLDAVREGINRDRAARALRAEMAELRGRYEALSGREREVMRFVVRGLLNKQIAAELGTAEATVKLHRGRVMKKMRADSLADLIRMGEKLGIPAYN